MRGRAPFVTLLVLCATVTLPAHAVDAPPPAVVARDGGVELVADDSDGTLCLAVRPSDFVVTSCDDAAAGVVATGESPGPVLHVGAAVPSSVASVEVQRAGRVVGTAATVAGEAYTGAAAGTVRFALVRLAPGTRSDGLRVHATDAAGRLVSVLAPLDGDLLLERHRLLRGRSGPVTWTLTDERTSSFEPSVLDLAREKVSRCIELTLDSDRPLPGPSGQSACSGAEPRDSLGFGLDFAQARLQDRCRPDLRLVHGVVPASVRRVTVLLGDGRRRSAPTVALRGGQWRVYALAIARRDAVRGVTLRGAATRFVRQAAAPLSVICSAPDSEASLFDDLFAELFRGALLPFTPAGPVATIAGEPAVRVADGPGDTLCVAAGDKPFTTLSCEIVAPRFDSVPGAIEWEIDATQFALALPATVAAVRLSSADRRVSRTIPTVAGEAYAGRYVGFVRFAAGTVANPRELPRLELLDAAGAVLHEEETAGDLGLPFANARVLAARRIAGATGRPSLWQTTLGAAGATRRCLALTAGPRPSEDDRCPATRSGTTVLLDASCVTRRLTVAVTAASGTRVRADAGASSPRPLRLRNGAGLLTLPASRPLRALTFTGRGRARRVRIGAPAGARQCGWRAVRKP